MWFQRVKDHANVLSQNKYDKAQEPTPGNLVAIGQDGDALMDSGKAIPRGDLVGTSGEQVLFDKTLVNTLLSLPADNAGLFTMAAAASTIVPCSNITAMSVVVCFPRNAAAGNLVQGPATPYHSANTPGESFTISTANGANAAGTEIFNYLVFN